MGREQTSQRRSRVGSGVRKRGMVLSHDGRLPPCSTPFPRYGQERGSKCADERGALPLGTDSLLHLAASHGVHVSRERLEVVHEYSGQVLHLVLQLGENE